MKTSFMILGLLVFNSCGSSDSGGGAETPNVAAKPETQSTPYTSYYVDTQNDLRACDVQTKGVLAYIKNTDQFMACLAEGWSLVNIRGKDGTNGKDGTPSSSNQWLDPVSGKVWVFTNLLTDTAGFLDANSSCTGNYRLPTSSEIFTGLSHGMKAAAQLILSPLPSQIMATGGVPYLLTNGAQGVAGLTAQFCMTK